MSELQGFDLLTEPWIDVVDADMRPASVGLIQALTEADRWWVLASENEQQDIALLRLLTAITARAVVVAGGSPRRTWEACWESGRLPVDEIRAYLDKFTHRFDLLSPQYPFLQIPGLAVAGRDRERDASALTITHPLFGPEVAGVVPTPVAARRLVELQAWALAGITPATVGDPRGANGRVMPIGVGWCARFGVITLHADTLARTVLLNLPSIGWAGVPPWERDPSIRHVDEQAVGPVNAWVWPSRRVLLAGDRDRIDWALVSAGTRFADGPTVVAVDPAAASAPSTQAQRKGEATPVAWNRARPLWLDLMRALGVGDAHGQSGSAIAPPAVVTALAARVAAGLIAPDTPITVRRTAVDYGPQSSTARDHTAGDEIAVKADILANRLADLADQAHLARTAVYLTLSNERRLRIGLGAREVEVDEQVREQLHYLIGPLFQRAVRTGELAAWNSTALDAVLAQFERYVKIAVTGPATRIVLSRYSDNSSDDPRQHHDPYSVLRTHRRVLTTLLDPTRLHRPRTATAQQESPPGGEDTSPTPTTSAPAAADGPAPLAAIRAWAKANGHPIAAKGRIPAAVVQAFTDAHSGGAASAADWPVINVGRQTTSEDVADLLDED